MSRSRIILIASTVALLGGLFALSLSPAGAAKARTFRGVIGIDVAAVAGQAEGDDWGDTASIGGKARTPLSDADVTVAAALPAGVDGDVVVSDSGEHACNGTWQKPTAPPDRVCIYIANADNATDIHGVSISPGSGGTKYGFKIVWDTPNDNQDSFVDAVWAYKPPAS